MTKTLEEMKVRHKKEMKSFEGEKLAAMKSAKSMGKKAKTAIKEAEFKYEALQRDLTERHRMETDQLTNTGEDNIDDCSGQDESKVYEYEKETAQTAPKVDEQRTTEQVEEVKRNKALQKKLKKKNTQRELEVNREKRISEENSMAGPSRRQMEMEALQTLYLHPRGFEVQEVEADGNCLYRAVGVQCRRLGLDVLDGVGECSHGKIREICANVLLGSNRAEYEPFTECGEGHASCNNGGDHPATFEEYVNKVRSTSTWGGQLELRALSEGLKRPIVVFSAEGPPLTMGAEYAPAGTQGGSCDDYGWDVNKTLLLSFHRHYYALGEHYNSVIPKLMK
jgi:OTU domain-containing protein 6